MHPRYPRSLALAGALALVLLCVLISLLAPTRAVAGDEPLALGSVSGTVKNAAGDPLPNITVQLEEYRSNSSILGPVTTNADGAFVLPSVLPGSYYLRFTDPNGLYAQLYYPSGAVGNEGTSITVNGNNVSGIEMVLARAATLAIQLRSVLTVPVAQIHVELYRQHRTGAWQFYAERYELPPNSVFAPASVDFQGLPASRYRVCAEVYTVRYYGTTECYDDVLPTRQEFPAELATDIPLAIGETHGITMTFGDLFPVQGTVVSDQGRPLPDILIYLSNPDNQLLNVETDAAGHFQIPMPSYILDADGFALIAADPSGEHLSTYYPDSPNLSGATRFKITPETRISVTLAMPTSALIAGRIQVEGGGTSNYADLRVFVHDSQSGWASTPCFAYGGCPITIYDASTGLYTVTRLAAGTYRIQAQTVHGESYYGGDTEAQAISIIVANGQRFGNADITIGTGSYEAAITGMVTANQLPQAGIKVGLFTEWGAGSALPILTTTSDGQGRYRFEGLREGRYKINFSDDQGRYAAQFYNPGCSDPCGNWLFLAANEVRNNANTNLAPGGVIHGQVRGPDGKPAILANVRIEEHPSMFPMIGYISLDTDAQGHYTTVGLLPGHYFVRATLPPTYSNERWYSLDAVATIPTSVTVVAGQTTPNIDIPFGLRPTAYLPLLSDMDE